jgi:hypothetical protein
MIEEPLAEEVVNQSISYCPLIIGSMCGFCSFCVGLITMEGVVVRKNSEGEKKIRFDNVWQYIKLPFDRKSYETAWGLIPGIPLESRLKLLNLNWVAMTGMGALCSLGYYYLKYWN